MICHSWETVDRNTSIVNIHGRETVDYNTHTTDNHSRETVDYNTYAIDDHGRETVDIIDLYRPFAQYTHIVPLSYLAAATAGGFLYATLPL